MDATQKAANPFPGLRPFEANESNLFFGRDVQIDELQQCLQRNRFVAVVGTSGSGKSSLVRAGLLPSYKKDFTAGGNQIWRVATFPPGQDPIGNLARALNKRDVLGTNQSDEWGAIVIETTLRLGDLGLAELARIRLPLNENLLIVVDQFEELFRFKADKPEDAADEAAAFVKLLLEAAGQQDAATYILLTMRSDYLGDCSQFRDLPEMINKGLYLVPRMTRDQLREAIRKPVELKGVKIETRLVNQLLNDVGDDPNQLPILQHALMRTWNNWMQDESTSDDKSIDLKHYINIGSMREALSQHGDEIYNELSPHKKIAETLFKCLTTKEDGRYIRRPTKLERICAIAKATEEDVIQIIDQFRSEGCSFLTPYTGEINSNDVIDISHESLIRIWEKLKVWSDEEANKAEDYHRLVEAYNLGDLLSKRSLEVALDWRKKYNPDEAWAEMYPDKSGKAIDFNAVMRFLEESEEKDEDEKAEKKRQQQERELQQQRIIKFQQERELQQQRIIKFQRVFVLIFSVAGVIILYLFLQARYQNQEAKKGQLNALSSSSEAYFASNQTLQALIESVKAGKQLKQSFGVDEQTSLRVMTTLRKMFYNVRERNILKGHTGNIYSVSFSPDGTKIATAGEDKIIRLWGRNGQFIRFLTKHEDLIRGLSFSPDGKILASVSDDETIKLWNFDNNHFETLGKHEFGITSVDFSPDGRTLVSGDFNGSFKIWNLNSKKLLRHINHAKLSVNSVKFSPDGKTIASASDDKTIKLWNVVNGQLIKTLKGHTYKVKDVSFSSDGKTIASASYNNTIKLWNVANGQLIKTLEGHIEKVNSVIFSPDGQTLASASDDKTIKLWKISDKHLITLITTLEGHIDKVNSVRFSPDSKIIASASDDGTIKLWSRDNQENMTILQTHLNNPNQIDFSPDGQMLVSASDNNAIALWNVSKGTVITPFPKKDGHKAEVLDVKFSPNRQFLATASKDQTIKIWNISKRNLFTALQGHQDWVNSVSFSPNGQMLASASNDKTIKLWNLDTKKLIATFEGHNDGVNSVSFSPDGKLIASASNDHKIKLWSVPEKALIHTFDGHNDSVYSVSFSPDGQLLASASADKFIKLWSVPTRNFIQNFKQIPIKIIYDINFSPDGQLIASGNGDKTIELWNRKGEFLNVFREHRGTVSSVSFSHDGRLLASISADETIIIRSLDLDSLLIGGCNKIRDYLENSDKDEERHLCDTLNKL
jgi:WD40 repeat protein/energy-coupling factor transporter ATP-binding protein EcfA2